MKCSSSSSSLIVFSFYLFLSFFSVFPSLNDAHGMMCGPRQRAAWHDDQRCGFSMNVNVNQPVVNDYCPHCLNGGTVATVKSHLPNSGWKEYDPLNVLSTANRAGLCGDPKTRYDHMIGGSFMPYSTVPISAVYKSGSEVDFSVEIDTNHNGYFEFHLCNLDDCGTGDIDEQCFQQKKCYKLERVPHDMCQDPDQNTHYECGPIDSNYPSRWYVPCRNTGHVGIHIVGGESGTMRYKLPEGVTCKHCVLQWYWATANSCNPPGQESYFVNYNNPFGTQCASDGGALGAHNSGLLTCDNDKVPEEFWSCSDVQISADGNSLGTVSARARLPTHPDSDEGDGDEAKGDPDGVIEDGKKEMEEDIEEKANENPRVEKKEEEDAAKGMCILENDPCDATVPCCDVTQVCVYTLQAGTFTCRFWWALWKEVEAQEEHRSQNAK